MAQKKKNLYRKQQHFGFPESYRFIQPRKATEHESGGFWQMHVAHVNGQQANRCWTSHKHDIAEAICECM